MNQGYAFSIKNTSNAALEYGLKKILITLPTFLRTYDALKWQLTWFSLCVG